MVFNILISENNFFKVLTKVKSEPQHTKRSGWRDGLILTISTLRFLSTFCYFAERRKEDFSIKSSDFYITKISLANEWHIRYSVAPYKGVQPKVDCEVNWNHFCQNYTCLVFEFTKPNNNFRVYKCPIKYRLIQALTVLLSTEKVNGGHWLQPF